MNQNIFRKAVEGEFNLNIDIKSRRFEIKTGIYNEKFNRILLFAKNSISEKETNMSIEQLVKNYNYYLVLSGKRLKQIEKLKNKIKSKEEDFDLLLNDLLANTD